MLSGDLQQLPSYSQNLQPAATWWHQHRPSLTVLQQVLEGLKRL